MTKELSFDIIKELHNIGYDTIAIVNDMGPSNMGLWRNLNISITNSSFEHPCTQRKIHVFADVPHLMKLLRYHLLDQVFVLPNGKFVGINIFQELINLNSKHDFKFAYTVSDRHLLVEGPGRMNVRLAVQLLSNSVAKAMAF
ncbi:unnamed protein product [Macrosiphum euphorbiae]|uniref:Transposable element P transposase-like GTP-binding insertion domain-containing protein n=1 Tax=Macrosiphum euphorbiae TaxID=13131 RepID=A0AAV0WVM7_9HEMI|nr:unnamed protein product [Macrosiphum euphorbiae]